MNYTQNYQLPQWAETDRILMEDFNDAFGTIETALSQLPQKGNCQIEVISYAGTGKTGNVRTPTLTFSAQPEAVFVVGGQSGLMVMHRDSNRAIALTTSGTHQNVVSWSGNQVNWYYGSVNGDGICQMNADNDAYLAVALIAAEA